MREFADHDRMEKVGDGGGVSKKEFQENISYTGAILHDSL